MKAIGIQPFSSAEGVQSGVVDGITDVIPPLFSTTGGAQVWDCCFGSAGVRLTVRRCVVDRFGWRCTLQPMREWSVSQSALWYLRGDEAVLREPSSDDDVQLVSVAGSRVLLGRSLVRVGGKERVF